MSLSLLLTLTVIFLLIGLLVTKNNAKYFLSGYNNMGELDRGRVDIIYLVKFLRSFFIMLSLSYLIIGLVLRSSGNDIIYIIFCLIYPFAGLAYFINRAQKFYQLPDRNLTKVLIVLLMFVVFVVSALVLGMTPARLEVKSHILEIRGIFGASIPIEDIRIIAVHPYPRVSEKISGFSLGHRRKGVFKTLNGDTATFLTVASRDSCMLIKTLSEAYFLDFEPDVFSKLNSIKK